MTASSGWRPMQKPNKATASALAPGPFARLARTHGLAAAADGLVTVALAGSIFFSISPSAARWRVALYLVLTIAPFAIVTPLIGPAIDRARGGRRDMIVGTSFARAIVAFLMVGHIKSFWLFPLAFASLVLQKAFAVAKSAVVPKLVDSQGQLVDANSKLALLSALGGLGGAAFAALLSLIGGPAWPAGCAVFVYIAAGLAGLQLPRVAVAEQPTPDIERDELHSAGIVLASTAMGVLRGVVGFLTFLMAFELRGGKHGVDIKPFGAAAGAATAIARHINIVGDPGAPAWHYGAVVTAAGGGALLGARLAPSLRRRVLEENMLLGVLGGTAVAGVIGAWQGGLFGSVVLALVVGIAASAGKLAFDSLVQRDAPDANYGRSFARFEARFQLTWVVGAFIPVVVRLPARFGFLLVAMASGFAAVSYFLSTRAARTEPLHAPAFAAAADDPDATTVLATADNDPTAVFTAPAPSTPPAPPERPSWADDPVAPVVTSVAGVEIDPDLPTNRREKPVP